MGQMIAVLTLYLMLCIKVNFCFQRICDHHDKKEYVECEFKLYHEVECKLCVNKYNGSTLICTWEYDDVTFETFLSDLPEDTRYLVVFIDTKREGILPYRTYDINLGYLVNLSQLSEFSLYTKTLLLSMSFQLNLTEIDISRFKTLKYLTLLRINIPLLDKRIILGSLIKNLPQLRILDLSYTRLLGKINIEDIIQNLNNSGLGHLCLRQIQSPGGDDYLNNFTSIEILRSVVVHSLEELDIAENGITNLPSVLSHLAPNLKYFDCSFNMLLSAKNWACFIDMIIHPTLEGAKCNSQGYISKPNDITHDKQLLGSKLNKFEISEYVFMKDCINLVSNGNGSNFKNSGQKGCLLVSCIFPAYFYGYDCMNAKTFPALNEVLCLDCVMYIKFPIGKNLKTIHFSNFEFDKVISGGLHKFSHKGYVMLTEPNNLQNISFHNNFAPKANESRGFADNIVGFKNLNNLTYVDFSANGYLTKYPVKSKLDSLQHLDLSQNNFMTTDFCGFAPNLKFLNLSSNKLTNLLTTTMHSCMSLEILDLSTNEHLKPDQFDKLDFNESFKLKKLILSNNGLTFLNELFLHKLNRLPNLTIDLQHNRFVCSCSRESQTFVKWLIAKGKENKLVNFEKLHCIGFSGSTFFSTIGNIDDFFKSCDESKWKTIGLSVGSTLGFILIIIGLQYCFKARWRIQYFLFNLKRKLQRLCCKFLTPEQNITWKYDAFISYCSDDRFWVHETLMKELEHTYGFKLCIHYRDFPVGDTIADTIVEKMNESRDVIFVLSNASISRHWCNYELEQARSTRSAPIFIILGNIDKAYLSEELAGLLDKQTYLKWSGESKGNVAQNKLFWKKLVAKLYGSKSSGACFCCDYDPESLGYRDIDEENTEDDVRRTAEYYVTQIEQMLNTGKYSRIAFGPIPTSVEKLLKDSEKEHIDKLVHKHCDEKLRYVYEKLKKHAS